MSKKQDLKPIGQTVVPLPERPELALDEMWSFVYTKANPVWIWLALERQTRRIVGFALGDRTTRTCRALWNSLPQAYRDHALFFTDDLDSYTKVLPPERHFANGKATGGTAHIERFNTTVRQRNPNFVRRCLSFSKKPLFHWLRLRIWLDHYNLIARPSL